MPVQPVINLMEYWIIILLMQYICSAHIHLSRRNILLCTGINLLGAGFSYLCPGYYNVIFHMVFSVALTVLLFSSAKVADLLRFFPAAAIYFTLTVASQCILDELVSNQINLTFQDCSMTLFFLITDVTLLVLLIITGCLFHRYHITLHYGIKEILGGIALLFFSFIDVGLVMLLNRSNLKPLPYYAFALLFIGAFVFSVGYYLYSIVEFHIRIYHQAVERNETEYLKLQLSSLQNIKENEEHVKRMRHDLSGHLALIHALCEEGNYEKVQRYTEQLSDCFVLPDNRVLTGNNTADLVVSSRKKMCDEYGISFSFEGSLQQLQGMAAPDICGLFANAYDNAIEACIPLSDAYIHTKVHAVTHYTVIKISNPVSKKIPVRNNGIATTKRDTRFHGYGIDIMKRIADKYKGSLTLKCDEKEFIVKIVLLNPAITKKSGNIPDSLSE